MAIGPTRRADRLSVLPDLSAGSLVYASCHGCTGVRLFYAGSS